MKILLTGNPNAGKSVVFNRLTGIDVISSNYPGTTIDIANGFINISGQKAELIDVPGIYCLEPDCKAEEIAMQMIKKGDVLLNVIDSTNLERSLNLTLQLIMERKPMIVVLNLFDETKHMGITINVEKLEQILGVPCIPTCALTGEGISELVDKIKAPRISYFKFDYLNRWNEIGKIISEVQEIKPRHHTFRENLRDASVKPLTGIPILIIVLLIVFVSIRFIGEGLVSFIFEPFFDKIWAPFLLNIYGIFSEFEMFQELLFGKLSNETIDYGQSFGLLTTGLYVPIGAVLPYVFAFYFVIAFLEDSGYLPRAAVLADNIMHKIGLHGLAIIPFLLGFGCNVPGALATRILETRKEKFISATLMSIAIPCMALQAMLFGLLVPYGIKGIFIVTVTLFSVWFILGFILRRIIKGSSPEIFVEIPPYRMPYFIGIFKKTWMRLKWFIKEAVPFVLLGVLIANILYAFGVIQLFSKVTAPFFNQVLGLPGEATGALIMGFLRKDLAIGMLIPLNLELKQLIVSSVVLSMYFPCVATFAVLLKELGIIDLLKSTVIMVLSAIITGAVLNIILSVIL